MAGSPVDSVLGVNRELEYGSRVTFVGALLDWVGSAPPTAANIAGAGVVQSGNNHLRAIRLTGAWVLGERPLELDGIDPVDKASNHWGGGYLQPLAERTFVERTQASRQEIRAIRSPVTASMVEPFTAAVRVVRIMETLTDHDYARLANWMQDEPPRWLSAGAAPTRKR